MSRIKPLVLAIDDDPVFRKLIEAVLTRLGVVSRTCADPVDFLQRAEKEEPDLLLVDLHIGDTSGLDLLGKIRAFTSCPVVVVSGTEDPKVVTHALECGANDFLLKPFDRLTLATKLSQFLETTEIADQRSFLHPVRNLGAEARLFLKGTLVGVDELGLLVESPHLVPKGTVARFATDWLKEIGANSQDCLVCITQTTLHPERKIYEHYGEFESMDLDFLQAVRKWLAERS